MSKPTKHHYVPKFFLRGFADARERLRVVERTAQPPSKRYESNVGDVASERNFYEMETHDGPSLEMEKHLSVLEADAARAIRKLTSGQFPPSAEDRACISMFVALQFLRGRDQRDSMQFVADQLVKFVTRKISRREIARLSEGEGPKPTPEEVARLHEHFQNTDAFRMEVHPNEQIKVMVENTPRLAEFANDRSWILFHFEEPCLATCDAPVFLWSSEQKRAGPYGHGFATCDEIRCSLDQQTALIMLKDGTREEAHVVGKLKQADQFNTSTVLSSFRRVFHNPAFDPLQGRDLPPPEESKITVA